MASPTHHPSFWLIQRRTPVRVSRLRRPAKRKGTDTAVLKHRPDGVGPGLAWPRTIHVEEYEDDCSMLVQMTL
eukprot:scaffold2682_cov155-Amphora_coffeaeformis.AAC.4